MSKGETDESISQRKDKGIQMTRFNTTAMENLTEDQIMKMTGD
jgi:hypothetical protein